ncbi:MFS transporter [Nocardioides convexus]|uniref:MFS transporter n=1 Tax=Nocardioides convexus TaxID=2712224 RepID=UPI0024184665|nr:MFS transporter [Nocardioides convexus]
MTALAEATVVSPWRGRHARTTLGVFSLAFLFAFEALAVATVMPDVAADLDGLRWYAVAFGAPLAAGIVALAAGGPQVDRLGPGPALRIGLVVFGAGVLVAGLAPDMPVFVVGRLVHGYGGGLIGVALYVVIAQAYPESLRPRVFAVLTTAWVLPALVGPVLAAQVADRFGWRWVFLGVPFLAFAAWLLVADAPSRPGSAEPVPGRLRWALAAAAGALAVSLGGQRVVAGWPLLVAAGLAAMVVAGLRVLPPGAWSGGPGLPAVLGTRAAISTSMAAAEVYVPLLLVLQRDLSIAQAGWVLTASAVSLVRGRGAGGAVERARRPGPPGPARRRAPRGGGRGLRDGVPARRTAARGGARLGRRRARHRDGLLHALGARPGDRGRGGGGPGVLGPADSTTTSSTQRGSPSEASSSPPSPTARPPPRRPGWCSPPRWSRRSGWCPRAGSAAVPTRPARAARTGRGTAGARRRPGRGSACAARPPCRSRTGPRPGRCRHRSSPAGSLARPTRAWASQSPRVSPVSARNLRVRVRTLRPHESATSLRLTGRSSRSSSHERTSAIPPPSSASVGRGTNWDWPPPR